MGTRDARIDRYILNTAPFARPILSHVRGLVHEGCPAVVETVKWGFPSFTHHGLLCNMAAFRGHCTFGFWNAALTLEEQESELQAAMGELGHVTAIADLPRKDVLIRFVLAAARFNEDAVQRRMVAARRGAPPLSVPPEVEVALKENPEAKRVFDDLAPNDKQEYVEWIARTKTDRARRRRLALLMASISNKGSAAAPEGQPASARAPL